MNDAVLRELWDEVERLKQDRNERVAEFEAHATTIRAMLVWIRTLPHGSEHLALIQQTVEQMLRESSDPLMRAAMLGVTQELFRAVEMGATGKKQDTN